MRAHWGSPGERSPGTDGSLQPPSSTRWWGSPGSPNPLRLRSAPPAPPGIPHPNPRVGTVRAAVTHFRTACLFASRRPTEMLPGAQVWGPAPGDPPPVHTAPREIPGALRHPVGVLAVLLPGVALSHHHPVSPPRELPPQGAAARSIAAPRTLGPAAGQGGGAPLAALCCGNRMWFGM